MGEGVMGVGGWGGGGGGGGDGPKKYNIYFFSPYMEHS